MAILVKPQTDGAHWYSANGEPVHTRPTAKGGTRNTTLADARKLALYPSVSGILGVLAKPGLEKWKIKQVLLAMKRTPQEKGEADEVHYDRVVNEAFEQVTDAADAGTGFHGAVLAALQGRSIDNRFRAYIDPIFAWMERSKIEPRATEVTVVNHEHGFAGTLDLAAMRERSVPCVWDWKTRRTKPGRPIESYETQPMQIAAYAATYWKNEWPFVIGGNIFISSTEPGRIELIPYDLERLKKEFAAFTACCEIWRNLNGYDPRIATSAAALEGPEIAKEKYQNVVISVASDSFPSLLSIHQDVNGGTKETAPLLKELPAPTGVTAAVEVKVDGESRPCPWSVIPNGNPEKPVRHNDLFPLKSPCTCGLHDEVGNLIAVEVKVVPTTDPAPAKSAKPAKPKVSPQPAATATPPTPSLTPAKAKETAPTKKTSPALEIVKAAQRKASKETSTARKPALPTIDFGKFKGHEVHNVPPDELEKLLKFSKPILANKPALKLEIELFLKGRKVGTKEEK